MIVEQLRCDQCHAPILTATRHLQVAGLTLLAPRHRAATRLDMVRDFCGEPCVLAYVRSALRDVDRESVRARDEHGQVADYHQFGGVA